MKIIKCPYCFHEFHDDEVLFRSEKVNKQDSDILPENFYEYENIDDFKKRYFGADKQKILDYVFFIEDKDPEYEEFWRKYNGTTEDNPVDKQLGIKAYERKIINPRNAEHQRYLKKQGDDYFIRDAEGMVIQIELDTNERCNRRVCPNCHNPLPDNYGRNPVKFATVIGITTAGKTVYLSQLLKGMKKYATKVGLSAIVNNSDVRTFIERNEVRAGVPLPNSTETMRLQQPLFYEMIRDDGPSGRSIETFVLYDVAGEVFLKNELVFHYAPFIEHSDGLILLLDPMQFDAFCGADKEEKEQMSDTTTALDAIHAITTKNKIQEKCDIPIAVCISKSDMKIVQEVLDDELVSWLKGEVVPVPDDTGFNKTEFNAKSYNSIFKKLNSFFLQNEQSLANQIKSNFSSYAYFAFSALGCNVEEGVQENGIPFQFPKGPILPKRIEEPLLWLFYKFSYITANEELFDPNKKVTICKNCGSKRVTQFPTKLKKIRQRFMLSKTIEVNHRCEDCGEEWKE